MPRDNNPRHLTLHVNRITVLPYSVVSQVKGKRSVTIAIDGSLSQKAKDELKRAIKTGDIDFTEDRHQLA